MLSQSQEPPCEDVSDSRPTQFSGDEQKQLARKRNRYPRNPDSRRVPQARLCPIRRIAILTCFFNPEGYVRIRENYQRFADHLARYPVDLWTIELAFDEDDFTLPYDSQMRRVRGRRRWHKLWQKERLLNLLLEQVPDEYDAIGWYDCDIQFTNRFWVEGVQETLQHYVWCQPFINSWSRDLDGGLSCMKRSAAWYLHFQPQSLLDPSVIHPGFAWVARSDWLRRNGLYDKNPTGGGDALMLKAVTSQPLSAEKHMTIEWISGLNSWANAARNDGGASLGFVPGDVIHLYHGQRSNRRYLQRLYYLKDHAYNPSQDVEIDPENGLLRWSHSALAHKRQMVWRVANYFSERREDD